MRDLIKKELRLLVEAKSWIEEHCDDAFNKKEDRYFCYAATTAFKNDFKLLQDKVREEFRNFVLNQTDISSINMQVLSKESDISKSGFAEFKWVSDHGQELCPNIRKNMEKVYRELLDGKHELYLDNDGKYHVVNRLDTNYSALGVMFTQWFVDKDIPFKLKLRGLESKLSYIKPVEYLIKSILYPNVFPPSSYESKLIQDIKLDSDALKRIFTDLINNQDLPHLKPRAIRVLEKVREVGFTTEKKFMNLLDEYGIEYKNFGKDYGFVDRFLGIDLFVKIGDSWFPAQTKTSKQEKTLIDTLGCRGFLEVYQKNGEFYVNNMEFDVYFCKQLNICKEQETSSEEEIY